MTTFQITNKLILSVTFLKLLACKIFTILHSNDFALVNLKQKTAETFVLRNVDEIYGSPLSITISKPRQSSQNYTSSHSRTRLPTSRFVERKRKKNRAQWQIVTAKVTKGNCTFRKNFCLIFKRKSSGKSRDKEWSWVSDIFEEGKQERGREAEKNLKVLYLRIKLQIEAKLVIEGFDEQWSAVKMFPRLEQKENDIGTIFSLRVYN